MLHARPDCVSPPPSPLQPFTVCCVCCNRNSTVVEAKGRRDGRTARRSDGLLCTRAGERRAASRSARVWNCTHTITASAGASIGVHFGRAGVRTPKKSKNTKKEREAVQNKTQTSEPQTSSMSQVFRALIHLLCLQNVRQQPFHHVKQKEDRTRGRVESSQSLALFTDTSPVPAPSTRRSFTSRTSTPPS
jgi:hypothetical protein